jgi:hypothetical protein
MCTMKVFVDPDLSATVVLILSIYSVSPCEFEDFIRLLKSR